MQTFLILSDTKSLLFLNIGQAATTNKNLWGGESSYWDVISSHAYLLSLRILLDCIYLVCVNVCSTVHL